MFNYLKSTYTQLHLRATSNNSRHDKYGNTLIASIKNKNATKISKM